MRAPDTFIVTHTASDSIARLSIASGAVRSAVVDHQKT
jgi:hypothetical protein